MYVKCPRCGINYIMHGEELCPICKRETEGLKEERYCYQCGKALSDDEDDICAECADMEIEKENL